MGRRIRITLPGPKDEISLEGEIKILYSKRKGYSLHDIWVSYPDPSKAPVWLVWEKNDEK